MLFKMYINSLLPKTKMWKYVDDVSISEDLCRNSNSSFQTALDSVGQWSANNWMELNASMLRNAKYFNFVFCPQKTKLKYFASPSAYPVNKRTGARDSLLL